MNNYRNIISSKIYDILISEQSTHYTHKSKEEIIKSWWYYPFKTSDNLRLSEFGYVAFVDAKIENYNVTVFNEEDSITVRTNPTIVPIILGKKLNTPYYYDNKNKFVIFDNKLYITIMLYGSISSYVDSQKIR